MEEKFIQLNEEDDILRLEIRDKKGNSTGEYLEFDLEDIEIPLKYQELVTTIKQNNVDLRNQFLIIDKRQDVKLKGQYLTKNEQDKLEYLQEYFKKQVETYNLFLGENGVQKLLNGRKIRWTTLQEVDDIIEKQIAPHFNNTMDKITKKVKEKYGNFNINKDNEEKVEVVE